MFHLQVIESRVHVLCGLGFGITLRLVSNLVPDDSADVETMPYLLTPIMWFCDCLIDIDTLVSVTNTF
ncbi:hypothetical protein CHS0354_023673, partial [Potamilus streckersoni]